MDLRQPAPALHLERVPRVSAHFIVDLFNRLLSNLRRRACHGARPREFDGAACAASPNAKAPRTVFVGSFVYGVTAMKLRFLTCGRSSLKNFSCRHASAATSACWHPHG